MSSFDLLFGCTVAATLLASIMVLVIPVAQRLLCSRLSPKRAQAIMLPILVTFLTPAQPLMHGVAKAAGPQAKSAKTPSTSAKASLEEESKADDRQATLSFTFRKVANIPTREQDDFRHARVAVSLDQEAVLSRNYIVSRGEDVRGRIGAYLWSLNPGDPKRTELPDSTTFGFVPHSTLAYQVSWGDGVQFWDTRTHSRSGDYIPHELREDTTIGPAISPNGKLMVTRSQLNHLRFWDISTRDPISAEMEQTGIVYGIKFSPDGRWFFAKTGKNLTIWQPETGKLVAGPFRHSIYSYAYSPNTSRFVTFENNDEKEIHWNSILVIRSGEAFTEINRSKLVGRAREASWIDDQHLLVIADNKAPGEKGPFSYRKRIAYLVTLTTDEPEIRKLMHNDWIRGSYIAPDHKHFIIRTRDETSCWKVGDREPIWTKPSDPQVSYGDRDWVLLHKGPVIVYSLDDGRELWRKNNVGICRVFGSKIWTCNENEMEIWQVEPDPGPE